MTDATPNSSPVVDQSGSVETDLGSDEPDTDDASQVDSKRSRRWWWLMAVVVVAAVAVAALLASSSDGDTATVESAVNTSVVEQTNLVVTQELGGTLGYGEANPVIFRSSADGVATVTGLLNGTVTAVVGQGATVASGDVLYEVNTEPIVVLAGEIPAYRAFNSRMSDGSDVQQLESALVELGYDPDGDITIDEDFTSATANAIDRLQESIGTEETGKLDLGDVIFAPSPFYAADVLVDVGDAVQTGVAIVATSKPVEGTLTTIVSEGTILGQGDELFTVDEVPVMLLIGDVPVFRALTQGTSGSDVEQLEVALTELGFGDDAAFRVDGVFDDATLGAVVAWQRSTNAAPDGVVNVGDVLFLPNSIRVGENLVSVGDPVRDGTALMTTSVNSTFVAVELSTDDQDLVAVGDAVVIVLPNGDREFALVTEIGTVVQANQSGGTYFEMVVTLDDPDAAPGLDEAPVDIEVVGDRADGVLVVPVTALVALTEGGYAVDVVRDDGSSQLVAVDPGLFADGFVEVTSSGLAEGVLVVVP